MVGKSAQVVAIGLAVGLGLSVGAGQLLRELLFARPPSRPLAARCGTLASRRERE